MTKQRDFKQLVRERMKKTGERYSSARAFVLAQRAAPAPAHPGVIAGYGPTGGLQGDTAILRNGFRHAGLRTPDGRPYSEALVHGLCGGVGFMYAVFEYSGHLPMLTVTTRSRSMPDVFAGEGLARAGAIIHKWESGSARAARKHLDEALEAGTPAICVVDTARLPYYGMPSELAGMSPQLVAVIGRDGDDAWLDDRAVHPIRMSMDVLAQARAGYRKAKHRLITVGEPAPGHDVAGALLDAVALTVRADGESPAASFRNNIGIAGMEKWQRLLTDSRDKKGWPKLFAAGAAAYAGLRRAYDCIQHDYTAPDAGRPLYAAFLDEAAALTGHGALAGVAALYRDAGALWNQLAARIADCSDDAVRRGCAISDRRAELIDSRGGDAAGEMAELWRERQELAATCQLGDAGARAIYADMAALLGRIVDIERAALARLAEIARA